MTYTETHHVVLTKNAIRQLRDKVIRKDTIALVASANNPSMAVRGWTVDEMLVGEGGVSFIQKDAISADYNYVYELHFAVTFTRADDKKPDQKDLDAILATLHTRALTPQFGRWTLATVDETEYVPPVVAVDVSENVEYADAVIPDEWAKHFEHLYGLDSHIMRVKKALSAGIDSGWRNRFHVALIGPPGCGKSDIAGSVREALGHDAVWVLDGTATTSAGAIKELSEMKILPRVIVIEEIEKADEKTMSFLLGVLDLRGEVRKTTARGSIQRDTKCFCIATVNDVQKFDTQQAGALGSRFSNRVHFNRPSRETLTMILAREIQKVNGRADWINPALDYCLDHGIDDPRKVIAFCLCGQDDLLDGSYQRMVDDTTPAPTSND